MPPANRTILFYLPFALAAIQSLASPLYAQSGGSFGPVLTVDLPGPFDRSIVIDGLRVNTVEILLWNHSTHRMVIASSDRDMLMWKIRQVSARFSFDDIVTADTDGDAHPELLFSERSSRSIRIVSDWRDVDSFAVHQTIVINRVPNLVVAGDIDRDGLVDLLVQDENEPGILPILNKGRGIWQKAPLIARDLPVRSMSLTYLNNDVMVDLVAIDWVRNELHTLYGVGRGRFLDQGIFPLDITVDRLVLHQPDGDRPLRAILLQRTPSVIEAWEMDDQGDLHVLDRRVSDKQITDISLLEGSGGKTRVAALNTPDRMRVFTFVHQPRISEAVEYGLPGGVVGLLGLPGGSLLGMAPGSHALSIFRPDKFSRPLEDSAEYVVGVLPNDIDAAQANGDSLVDLVLTNEGSRSISFLPGLGSGAFGGQIAFEMPDRPAGILAGVPGDTSIRIYAAHPESDIVSASEVDVEHQSIVTSEIPTPGSPDVLSEITGGNGIVMFAALHNVPGAGAILSLYERLKEETFLERTFQLSPPAVLVGATITDFDKDDRPDIVFVYKSDESTELTIGVAYGDSAFTMRRRQVIQEFPSMNAEKAFVWSADLNGDGMHDLLVAFPKSAQQLYVLRAETDSTFGVPTLIDSLVRFEAFSQLRIVDVNGDRLPDLLALLPQRGGVGWWANVGGTFAPWKYLTGSHDVAGFVVRDLNGDGTPDIALTQPSRGSIGIHNGKRFGWGKRSQ